MRDELDIYRDMKRTGVLKENSGFQTQGVDFYVKTLMGNENLKQIREFVSGDAIAQKKAFVMRLLPKHLISALPTDFLDQFVMSNPDLISRMMKFSPEELKGGILEGFKTHFLKRNNVRTESKKHYTPSQMMLNEGMETEWRLVNGELKEVPVSSKHRSSSQLMEHYLEIV